MLLEACADSISSALAAQRGGADRVELTANLLEGGTSPSPGTVAIARKLLSIGLYVMVRPRGGDFLYSPEEFGTMKADIIAYREAGADGIVTGILRADGTIDEERMSILISLARPMSVTFHRAFDMTSDPFQSLGKLIKLKTDRILTSGQKSTALEGAGMIRLLVERSAGQVAIMPGNGINEDNLAEIARLTGASEFHAAMQARVKSKMTFFNRKTSMGKGTTDEFEWLETSETRVRRMKDILKNLQQSAS
jgi:copper homeostasis protein